MGDPADGGQRWSTGEVNNQTGATSEARWSTGGISGSGTEYGERHRKTPAGGTECRERPPPLEGPDATESERHMENDHLVIRGSVENAPSGYPLVFRRRLSTAHGGGPACPGVSAEEPLGTTAEEHAGMPHQPPPARSKTRTQAGLEQEPSRARCEARVWLGTEVEEAEKVKAEADVEAERRSKRPKTSWWTYECLDREADADAKLFEYWTALEARGVPRYDPKA